MSVPGTPRTRLPAADDAGNILNRTPVPFKARNDLLFHLVWLCRIDCFLISSRQPELLRLHLQLYSARLNFFGGGGEAGGK